MAAVGTDKELSDLLDFSAVRHVSCPKSSASSEHCNSFVLNTSFTSPADFKGSWNDPNAFAGWVTAFFLRKEKISK